MGAKGLAILANEGARGGLDVVFKKRFKWALANEADACAVALFSDVEPLFFRDGTHLRFCQVANWKEDVFKRGLLDGVEEVGLVFIGISASKQMRAIGLAVVSSGEVVAHGKRFFQKKVEFDLAVAEDVGIRGIAKLDFRDEVTKNALLILFDKVDSVEGDADLLADFGNVFIVLFSVAMAI